MSQELQKPGLTFDLFASLTEILFDMERVGRWNESMSALREATSSKSVGLFLNAIGYDGNEGGVRKGFSKTTGIMRMGMPTWVPYKEVPSLYESVSAGLVHFGTIPEDVDDAEKFCIVPLSGGERAIGFVAFAMGESKVFFDSEEVTKLCRIMEMMSSAIREDMSRKNMKTRDARLNFVVGMSGDVVLELSKDLRIEHLWGNPPHGFFKGSSRRSAVEGSLLSSVVADKVVSGLLNLVNAPSSSGNIFSLAGLGGEIRYISVTVAQVPNGDDDDSSIVLLIKDVTGVVEGDSRHRMLVEAVDRLDEAIIDLSQEGQVENASSGWNRMLSNAGFVETGVYGNLSEYADEGFEEGILDGIRRVSRDGSPAETFKFKMGNESRWVEARLFTSWSDISGRMRIRGILRDITSAHLQGELIKKMATHDSLTGIPNRHFMEETLRMTLSHAQRTGEKVAVGFVDCDYFKEINDTYGHKSGDLVLCAVSERMRSALRESDMVSRWGGDEFVVMLPGVENVASLHLAEARLRDFLHKEIELESGKKIMPSLSMGFAIFPDDAPSDMEELLSCADQAVYAAKSAGRGQSKFYSDLACAAGGRDDPYMRKRFIASVIDGGIQVFCQPFVLPEGDTWIECLPRWQDEIHGWQEEESLLEMADHAGVSKEVYEQLFAQSLAHVGKWIDSGCSGAVFKIGKTQLFSKDFSDNFANLCRKEGVPLSAISFAIKENLVMLDMSKSSGALERLVKKGFVVMLDRFGTGPSLLPFMNKLPISQLRIHLSDKDNDLGIPSSIEMDFVLGLVSWLSGLGRQVVVSGVNDADLKARLEKYKVAVQGEVVLPPSPPGLLSAWLSER